MHKTPAPLSFTDMRRFLGTAWGEKGLRTADAWLEFNRTYFGGKLQPIPIIFTHAQPYGKRIAFTCIDRLRRASLIALNDPSTSGELVADRGVLLHEMIHQHLVERDLNSAHNSEPWCAEIMRLHRKLTGQKMWACRQTVGKKRMPEGGRMSVRVQKCCPETGVASLPLGKIASWPHSVEIDLGPL